jgi:putative transposase
MTMTITTKTIQLAYKYRIYPNREQEMLLKRSLLSLCNLYNKLRELKIRKYKEDGTNLTLNYLRKIALEERRNSKELQSIHSQVVQEVADRVYNAFDRFFEGIARFPRYKQPKKYRSLTYTQSGFRLLANNNNNNSKLYLSKIGYVRIFMHRPLEGKVVRLTVKYEAGEWYAIFIVEKEVLEPNTNTKTIIDDIIDTIPDNRIKAIDLGINNFITLDDGLTIEYPKYLRNTEDKIKVLQKHLSRKKRGSRRWRQLCFRLARLHLHIKRQREDFHNKVISWLLKHNDVIIIERLNVNSMIQSSSNSNSKGLTKSITDVSFGTFIRKIISKARMILGKYVIVVDPTNTSQFCYNCLTFVYKELKDREHICPKCNVRIDRDLNSAKLIRRIGLDGISLRNNNNGDNKKKNKTDDSNNNTNNNNNNNTALWTVGRNAHRVSTYTIL